MKEECGKLFREVWESHRGCFLGAVLGALTAVSILLFGFWNMLFIGLCVAVGLWIGYQVDQADDGALRDFRENGLQNIRSFIRQRRGKL